MLVVCCVQYATSQHKVWKEFTIEDGLPGSAVYSILQAKNNYLWFSSNRGVFWFDGTQFREPVDTSRYANSEAFSPVEDPFGRIWFTRLDNSIWFIDHDTVKAWQFNNIINDDSGRTPINNQLSFDSDGRVWISMGGVGFIAVDKNGHTDTIQIDEGEGYIIKQLSGETSKNYFNHYPLRNTRKKINTEIKVVELVQHKANLLYSYTRTQHPFNNYFNAWYRNDHEVLLYTGGNIVVISNRQPTSEFPIAIPVPIICASKEGHFYVGTMHGDTPGLYFFPTLDHFRAGTGEKMLSGYRVHSILEDHEGGVWVTTQEGPLLYCKNPHVDIYDITSGLSANEVIRLASDNEQWVYAGTGNLDIFRIQVEEGIIEKLPQPGLLRTWEALLFEPSQKKLWASSPLASWELDKWNKNEFLNQSIQLTQHINAKKISRSPSEQALWMSSTFGFFKLNLENLEPTYFNEHENPKSPIRTFAVEEDVHGNIWVATIHGLRMWENESYRMPIFSHPALKYQARDLARLPDESLLIAFAGAGLLIYDTNKIVTHIDANQGLCSGFITKIVAGTDGEILACTDKGLNRLVRRDSGVWDVQVITSTDGLPSNLVYDVVAVGNELWIATAKGLVRTKVPEPKIIPDPKIIECAADSLNLLNQSRPILPHDFNNIRIRYESVHFRSEGNILYRYRLLPGDRDFTMTDLQQVTFPNLAPGSYTFEVQAGIDGSWSKTVSKTFEILPPWWKTFWFISLCIIAIAAIGWLYYSRRLKNFKKEAEQSAKIKDLELAALRAQMNPHFIFNCLGSIQQFISAHKPEEATRYLSRFARLIRLALHSSVDGKHSLTDEINMLDHYLALEQMRFKNKFEYSIRCDDTLDPDDITIPPLMIQPFIENAVMHGMKSKANDGQIEVSFERQQEMLQVIITDNGPGFSDVAGQDQMDHKSVGMKLTRSRLGMMSNLPNAQAFHQENLYHDDGNACGSRITIQLPLHELNSATP